MFKEMPIIILSLPQLTYQQFQFPPTHNPFQALQCPNEPTKTILLTFLHLHTNAQMLFLHTSNQTYDLILKTPQPLTSY